jgi:hypothetical protein
MAELTVKDTMTLDFERQWWKYPGAKDSAIHTHFAETRTRYYQRLNALIDRPEALAYDALVVKRLRRLRDARAQQRAARRVAL